MIWGFLMNLVRPHPLSSVSILTGRTGWATRDFPYSHKHSHFNIPCCIPWHQMPSMVVILGFSSNRGTYSPSQNSFYKLILFSWKHRYRLSGGFLFLFVAQVTSAIGFHFRNILLDRSAVVRGMSRCVPFSMIPSRSCSAKPQTVSESCSYDQPLPPSPKSQYHCFGVHSRHFRSLHPRLWSRARCSSPYIIPDPVGFPFTKTFPWSLYTGTMESRVPLANSCTFLA
jgi:hypothetical protein